MVSGGIIAASLHGQLFVNDVEKQIFTTTDVEHAVFLKLAVCFSFCVIVLHLF